jgi:hypothetical protein
MEEGRKDWTTFTGNFAQVVFDTAGDEDLRNCKYDLSKIGPLKGRLVAQGGKDNHDPTPYGGTGLIQSAECVSDTPGNDAGKLGCRKIQFAPVQLLFTHAEDAFSGAEIAARRQNDTARRRAIGHAVMTTVMKRSVQPGAVPHGGIQ